MCVGAPKYDKGPEKSDRQADAGLTAGDPCENGRSEKRTKTPKINGNDRLSDIYCSLEAAHRGQRVKGSTIGVPVVFKILWS